MNLLIQIRSLFFNPFFVIALFLLALTGCSTNPVTERPQLMLVSEANVIAGSYQAFAEIVAVAKSNNNLNTNQPITERVRKVAFRIIPHAVRYRPDIINWQWEVHVFNDEEPNAFCMAGGKIGVNSGLISKIKPTEDELAQVIAHEIAHALSEHSREKISVAIAGGILVSAVAASRGMTQTEVNALDALATLAITLPNSRSAESEADRIGILLATNAGYDPDSATSLWAKMLKHSGERVTSILSTHPLPSERIAELQIVAHRLKPTYERTKVLRENDRLPIIEYSGRGPENIFGRGIYLPPPAQR